MACTCICENCNVCALKTVRWVLYSLNLCCCHVSVRQKNKQGLIKYLGGGSMDSVINRFGAMYVIESYIVDDVLIMFVR